MPDGLAANMTIKRGAGDTYNSCMRRSVLVLIIALTTFSAAIAQSAKGTLVIMGGGDKTESIVARTLQLAGGNDAVVAVLPQSSADRAAGDSSVKMWLDAGARSARKVDFKQPDAKRALEAATLIWIPGGNQNRFMASIRGTGLDDVIRAQYRKGTVVGGTSAGAAVMGEWMLTGDGDPKVLTAGSTVITKGLALWPGALIDQHFLARHRSTRLLSAVLERPTLIGVGIDEATAIVVRGDSFEVLGKSAVVVFDARDGRVEAASVGAITAATNVRLSVLKEGMNYSLKR
jgi:cyanophycinase